MESIGSVRTQDAAGLIRTEGVRAQGSGLRTEDNLLAGKCKVAGGTLDIKGSGGGRADYPPQGPGSWVLTPLCIAVPRN